VVAVRTAAFEAFPAASSAATPIGSGCPHERFENVKVVDWIVVTTAAETEIR
jgi:hypothetical protein